MARCNNRVLLGFEDVAVEDYSIDFSTNKVGGTPNWICDLPKSIKCCLCDRNLVLIMQIYAPLDKSVYHRTLYIFACINSDCWNQNESWLCLRGQKIDSNLEHFQNENIQATSDDSCKMENWCSNYNDWDSDEINGNSLMETVDSFSKLDLKKTDEDDDKSSKRVSFNVTNANSPNGIEGAMGGMAIVASAIIEGDEGEGVITIDSPTRPQINLVNLLEQAAPTPVDMNNGFYSFFIKVYEEELNSGISPLHKKTDMFHCRGLSEIFAEVDDNTSGDNSEVYEKSIPAHGDKMFHQFITRIQANPGQIVRYGGAPLWLYPLDTRPTRYCNYCNEELTFELQILPTLIPKLKLTATGATGYLEFGSVYIFTCKKSCWDKEFNQLRSEIVIVQKERI